MATPRLNLDPFQNILTHAGLDYFFFSQLTLPLPLLRLFLFVCCQRCEPFYHILGFKNIQKHFSETWVTQHTVMFFKAWSSFRVFYDGFFSHEFKSLINVKVKKLLVTFSYFGQVILVIFQTLYKLKLSATVFFYFG